MSPIHVARPFGLQLVPLVLAVVVGIGFPLGSVKLLFSGASAASGPGPECIAAK